MSSATPPADAPLPDGAQVTNGRVSFSRGPADARTSRRSSPWADARDVELEGLTIVRPSLEDVYLELTAE